MNTHSNSAPSMSAMPPPGNVVFSDRLIEKMITSCLDDTVNLSDDHQISCRVGSQVIKIPISLFPIAPSISVQSVPLQMVGDEFGEMNDVVTRYASTGAYDKVGLDDLHITWNDELTRVGVPFFIGTHLANTLVWTEIVHCRNIVIYAVFERLAIRIGQGVLSDCTQKII